MDTEKLLLFYIHTFNYFVGVPRLLIPDNCKTAVSKNTRYEIVLNKSYQTLQSFLQESASPTTNPKQKALCALNPLGLLPLSMTAVAKKAKGVEPTSVK